MAYANRIRQVWIATYEMRDSDGRGWVECGHLHSTRNGAERCHARMKREDFRSEAWRYGVTSVICGPGTRRG